MCKSGDDGRKKEIYEEWEKTRFTGEYWEWGERMNLKAKI
jgi:dual specificity phosphatase 12